MAEDAKFDSLFLADGPALTGSGEFRPPGQLEPLTLLTALSQHTSRIGLIATVSSTYNEPYNLARRLASVDHVSGGRAGWNIVTSAGADEAANFGLDDRPDHAARYERADEFLDVAKALWDSWESEAVLADKASGRYADPARLHAIDHAGSHFKVAGPLNVERPPQGYPLLVQAGSSEDGKNFAARHAEAIFTAHQTYERAADFYGDIKARTKAAGRDPDGVLVLPGIVPFIGSTEREARELARQLDELRIPEYGLWQLAWNLRDRSVGVRARRAAARLHPGAPETGRLAEPLGSHHRTGRQRENLTVREILSRLGGGRGHFTFVGTPDQVADTIISWFEGGAADGFNIMAPALPSGLETFIEHVLPILRGKGLFREEYAGATLREHYGLPVPANQFRRDARDCAVPRCPVDQGLAQGLPRTASPRSPTSTWNSADGAFFGLLGPNGAGKTTLIGSVCNIVRPTAGQLTGLRSRLPDQGARRLIGLAEQEINVDRFLSVRQLLDLSRRLSRHRTEDRGAPSRRTAAACSASTHKADGRAYELSGGMQRRLVLARALIHQPRLLILDEPTAGVDVELRSEIWRLVKGLNAAGTTILLTTHYLQEAETLCDEIALILAGRIVDRGSAASLRDRYEARDISEVYDRVIAAEAAS